MCIDLEAGYFMEGLDAVLFNEEMCKSIEVPDNKIVSLSEAQSHLIIRDEAPFKEAYLTARSS